MWILPEQLIPFILASAVLLVIPGPTVVMVVSQALGHGRRIALAGVLGVGLGDLIAATLSLTGVGTILAASALAFLVLKWVGALYLIFIAVKLWRAPVPDLSRIEVKSDEADIWRIFRDAFLVTVFNPKGIVFFVAFVPQFISAERAFAPQAALLVATFVLLGILNAYGYMMLAAKVRTVIARPRILKIATRLGASFLMGAGLLTLVARRPT